MKPKYFFSILAIMAIIFSSCNEDETTLSPITRNDSTGIMDLILSSETINSTPLFENYPTTPFSIYKEMFIG